MPLTLAVVCARESRHSRVCDQ